MIDWLNNILWSYVLIALLLFTGIYFTLRSRGVQFRMFGEMIRLLCSSGKRESDDSTL